MSFGYRNTNVYAMSTDKFSGIDLRHKVRKTLSDTAVAAENVFINDEGEIEKRTGFKSLFSTDETKKVNGVYLYQAGNETEFYIIHLGTKLYETDRSFSYKKLIYSQISDSRSKGFLFGGSFYILCGGYFKLSYMEALGCIGVCRVCDTYRRYENECESIVSGRSMGALDGERNVINFEYGFHSIDFRQDKYYFDSRNSSFDKLYIARSGAVNDIRVVSLSMGSVVIKPFNYKVEEDEKGMYLKLDRQNDGVKEFYECEPRIVIRILGFVYSPVYVMSRKPVGITDIGGAVKDEFLNSPFYTGVYTQDLNAACSLRKINFFVDFALYSSCGYLRFYLDDFEVSGKVTAVRAGGKLFHSYVEQDGAYDTADIIYDNANRYVDIKKSVLSELSGGADIAVEIEFYTYSDCEDIDGCDIFGFYGSGNDTRVFLAGNEKKPACDFESGNFEGSYFPELSYTTVGNDYSKILGYGRYFSYQLVFKDGNGDAQMYFRMHNEESGYKILKGNTAVCAAGKNCVININSKLFVLSGEGLYSIEQTQVEGECRCVLRSEAVNSLLRRERLASAEMAEVEGRLWIFGEERIYVLDISKNYSWYIYKAPERLYGAADISFDVFLYDKGIVRMADKEEENAYFDFDKPVCALWKTNFVSFLPQGERDILSAYCCLYECGTRSGAEILYCCDDYDLRHGIRRDRDLFSFEDIDFSRFSFWCVHSGRTIKTHLRSKRVKKFCVAVKNDRGEPFKICEIGFLYR